MAERVKSLSAMQETLVQSLGWEDPLEKEMEPTPEFLPGKSHGSRSLVGYRPWGHKESDTTERLHFHFSKKVKTEIYLKTLQFNSFKYLPQRDLYTEACTRRFSAAVFIITKKWRGVPWRSSVERTLHSHSLAL